MAADVAGLGFSMTSVVENMLLQQHATRPRDVDLESRKAEEAGILSLSLGP